METTVAGLLQRGQPQGRLADARFALHEQARRLVVHRDQEVSYGAELRRTTDYSRGHQPMMTASKREVSENSGCHYRNAERALGGRY